MLQISNKTCISPTGFNQYIKEDVSQDARWYMEKNDSEGEHNNAANGHNINCDSGQSVSKRTEPDVAAVTKALVSFFPNGNPDLPDVYVCVCVNERHRHVGLQLCVNINTRKGRF